MAVTSETIELIQWHCSVCHDFGGGMSIVPAQLHADETGHVVKAEVTMTVREDISVVPAI